MPRRILNWDVEVTGWAIRQLDRPFAWGSTDCASLARAMLEVMYRDDLLPTLPAYSDRRGAEAVWRATGGARSILALLGAVPLPALLHANTGDFLVAEPRSDEPFEALIPVITNQMLITEPDRLVRLVPLIAHPTDAVAWRLPFQVTRVG